MHGYEIIQALSDRFGGTYVPSAGTIYPRLAKLEAEGLVTKESDGRKSVYAITDAGRAELNDRRDELEGIENGIGDSVRRLADEVRASVSEAMTSLRAELAAGRATPVMVGVREARPTGRARRTRGRRRARRPRLRRRPRSRLTRRCGMRRRRCIRRCTNHGRMLGLRFSALRCCSPSFVRTCAQSCVRRRREAPSSRAQSTSSSRGCRACAPTFWGSCVRRGYSAQRSGT